MQTVTRIKKFKIMATNKLLCSFRIIGVFSIMLICALSANAQFLRTSYFMEGTHYRQQLNPALTPTKGYFNLPVIGALNASVSSTSLGYQDILDIIDDDGEFYKNQDFLGRLKNNNTLNLNFNTEILSAGWYKGKNFWTFNVGLRTDIGATVTKSLFEFLNEVDEISEWNNQNFNIGGQEVNIQAYTEVGLGLSRQINDRLTVGAKVKALLGIGNMNLKISQAYMKAKLPTETRINEIANTQLGSNWESEIANLKTEISDYNADLRVDATLESSFKGLELLKNDDGYVDDLDFDAGKAGIAGWGLGFDLGASYKIMDNLTVSASILDLGFLTWSKNSTQIATANGGVDMKGEDYVKKLESATSLEEAQNAIRDFGNESQDFLNRASGGDVLDFDLLQMTTEQAAKSRKSRLAATLVLGAEYGFFNNKLAVGGLYTTRFVQPKAMTELTFSANYRPKSWFNVALSYSVIQSAGKSFGLGLKLGPVFLGTDYMFLGKNSNSVNGFVGVSIPLGGRKVSKQG